MVTGARFALVGNITGGLMIFLGVYFYTVNSPPGKKGACKFDRVGVYWRWLIVGELKGVSRKADAQFIK